MPAPTPTPHYALGSSDPEQARLIRQAALLAPYTERFFRAAGIATGQRVLDLGSGVGDVAILLAQIVGPSGEVVGIERDIAAITRARARVAEAGLQNVTFLQSDVSQVATTDAFDAAVGRFILMFLPSPAAVLRSLSHFVRPGGVIAFQEPSWEHFLQFTASSPLWFAAASLAHETFQRSGANTEMGFALPRIYQEAGLPAPALSLEMPAGEDAEITRWIPDLLLSLRPHIEPSNPLLEKLGDLDSLRDRLQAEVAVSKAPVSFVALVGASSRKSAVSGSQ